jgi:hypothetical protein
MINRPKKFKRKIDMTQRILKTVEWYWRDKAEPYIHWQILERSNDDFMPIVQPQEFKDALNAFKIQQ